MIVRERTAAHKYLGAVQRQASAVGVAAGRIDHGEVGVGDVDVFVPVLAAVAHDRMLEHVAGDKGRIFEAQVVPVARHGERGAAVPVGVPADRIIPHGREEDRLLCRAADDQRHRQCSCADPET